MKKTIFNQNYSLLVLVLLILYITYINIPDNLNMKGGAPNPYDTFSQENLNKVLMKESVLFSVLYNYWYVYIGINVVLLIVLGYYAYSQYLYQGVPFAGVDSALSWDAEGQIFLTNFYALARTKYNLFTPGAQPVVDNKDVVSFEKEADKLVLEARAAVDTFCHIVSPCDVCGCSGPDPNYAGPSTYAPDVLYQGINTVTQKSCSTKLTNDDGTPSAAAQILASNEARGISHKYVGRLPSCCCNLLVKYANTPQGITKDSVQNLIKNPPVAKGDSLGFLGPGCDPHSPPPTYNTPTGPVTPHRDNSGASTFVSNMIASCTSTEKTMGDGKTVQDYYIKKCQNYDPNVDLGVSMYHVTKPENSKHYFSPAIGNNGPSGSAVAIADTDPDWKMAPNPAAPPKIVITKPTDWPKTEPFTSEITEMSYWFTDTTGIKYALKIDNHLYEIYAYPALDINKIKRAVKEIIGSGTPTGNQILSIDGYEYLSRGVANYVTNMFGEYIFP